MISCGLKICSWEWIIIICNIFFTLFFLREAVTNLFRASFYQRCVKPAKLYLSLNWPNPSDFESQTKFTILLPEPEPKKLGISTFLYFFLWVMVKSCMCHLGPKNFFLGRRLKFPFFSFLLIFRKPLRYVTSEKVFTWIFLSFGP